MGAQHKEPKHLQVVFFTDFPDRKKIPQGLGHFFIIDI